jgi:hypothetical protein
MRVPDSSCGTQSQILLEFRDSCNSSLRLMGGPAATVGLDACALHCVDVCCVSVEFGLAPRALA